jgi:hypothetical protein
MPPAFPHFRLQGIERAAWLNAFTLSSSLAALLYPVSGYTLVSSLQKYYFLPFCNNTPLSNFEHPHRLPPTQLLLSSLPTCKNGVLKVNRRFLEDLSRNKRHGAIPVPRPPSRNPAHGLRTPPRQSHALRRFRSETRLPLTAWNRHTRDVPSHQLRGESYFPCCTIYYLGWTTSSRDVQLVQ